MIDSQRLEQHYLLAPVGDRCPVGFVAEVHEGGARPSGWHQCVGRGTSGDCAGDGEQDASERVATHWVPLYRLPDVTCVLPAVLPDVTCVAPLPDVGVDPVWGGVAVTIGALGTARAGFDGVDTCVPEALTVTRGVATPCT